MLSRVSWGFCTAGALAGQLKLTGYVTGMLWLSCSGPPARLAKTEAEAGHGVLGFYVRRDPGRTAEAEIAISWGVLGQSAGGALAGQLELRCCEGWEVPGLALQGCPGKIGETKVGASWGGGQGSAHRGSLAG